MRVAQSLLRSAAAAGIASFAAACVVPPAGIAPRPEEAGLGSPEVKLSSFDSEEYGSPSYGPGSGLLAYSVSRDAYAATFEVDQRGRVRVLSPETSDADTRVESGRSYVVSPPASTTDREFLVGAQRDFDRIPFVFVITADTPLNLSAFARGKTWSRSLTLDGYDPDSVMSAVADRVVLGQAEYSADYAYVGPQLRGAEVAFASDCGRPLTDVHDYRYFRELWAVYTPQDQRLSYNPAWFFSPALGWSSYSFLPVAQYRAQLATTAFYGACSPGFSPYYYSARFAAYPYGGGYGQSSLYGAYPYGAYPYGAYSYGASAWGAYAYGTGGRGAGTSAAHNPSTPLRLPRTPLSFVNPIAVAGGGTRTGQTPAGQTSGRTMGLWMLGRRATGLGPSDRGPMALAWRSSGSGRQPGEVQGIVRPGYGFGQGRPGMFIPAERRNTDQRPVGMGFGGRGSVGMTPGAGPATVHRDPGAGGQSGFGAGHAAATHAPASSAGAAVRAGTAGSAPAPK